MAPDMPAEEGAADAADDRPGEAVADGAADEGAGAAADERTGRPAVMAGAIGVVVIIMVVATGRVGGRRSGGGRHHDGRGHDRGDQVTHVLTPLDDTHALM